MTEKDKGGVSDINAFKMRFEAQTAAPPAIPVFKPLKSWPAKPELDPNHKRRAEYAGMPSRYA